MKLMLFLFSCAQPTEKIDLATDLDDFESEETEAPPSPEVQTPEENTEPLGEPEAEIEEPVEEETDVLPSGSCGFGYAAEFSSMDKREVTWEIPIPNNTDEASDAVDAIAYMEPEPDFLWTM
ncbi:MAG: hypothetical protein CL916_15135, partial [Deltaproteobacteria bacterium]|nr:hypothetical protein [Deltaproteobacteria bacterium]